MLLRRLLLPDCPDNMCNSSYDRQMLSRSFIYDSKGVVSRSYWADCVAWMRKQPEDAYDLAHVDPPYFSGPERRQYYGGKVSSIGVSRESYQVTDTWEVPGPEYFEQLFRVSKHQIIWGSNYYDWQFGPGRIIWDKVNGNSSYSDAEIAYTSLHDSVRIFRYMWNGMMHGKSIEEGHIVQGNKRLNEKRIHPTQKPVNLYRWVNKTYVPAGWKILDTHLGSGTHRIACFEAGLDFTGTELNETHWRAGNEYFMERIDPDTRTFKTGQPNLFDAH